MAKQRLSEQEQASLLDGLLIPKQEPLPTQMRTPATHVQRTPAREQTWVFKQSDMRRALAVFVRYSAWLALVISCAGSVQAIAGRWPTALATIFSDWPWYAWVLGLGAQLAVTLVEWGQAHRRGIAWWVAFAVDVMLTYFGYASLFLPWLLDRWKSAGVDAESLPWVAALTLVGLSASVALYPEQMLVKHDE